MGTATSTVTRVRQAGDAQRHGKPFGDHDGHRLLVEDRLAEVAAQHLRQPVQVLNQDRSIQAHLAGHRVDLFGRHRLVAEQRPHRIARHQPGQDEDQRYGNEDGRDEREQSPSDIAPHTPSVGNHARPGTRSRHTTTRGVPAGAGALLLVKPHVVQRGVAERQITLRVAHRVAAGEQAVLVAEVDGCHLVVELALQGFAERVALVEVGFRRQGRGTPLRSRRGSSPPRSTGRCR